MSFWMYNWLIPACENHWIQWKNYQGSWFNTSRMFLTLVLLDKLYRKTLVFPNYYENRQDADIFCPQTNTYVYAVVQK